MQGVNRSSSIYKINNLLPNNIISAFSIGKLNYDYRAGNESEVLKNRKDFFYQAGLALDTAVFPQQVHKANILKVEQKDKGRGAFSFAQGIPQTDALITNAKGIALCLLSADCLPIIFYEANGRAIGIAHAGWRGIHAGIIEKTILAMANEFAINREDIKAFFGPAIGSCCYEVGPEFLDIFPENISARNNKTYLDIKSLARIKCLSSGIFQDSINDVSICTKCSNDTFFSYRSGDNLNRLISIVAIGEQCG
ncbi:MAG: peptidoglycan editing factor PgeF [Candidatus Omnitrophota bacterium]